MEVWNLLFAVGNVLHTEKRGAPFEIIEFVHMGIKVRVQNGGREVTLTHDRLWPLLVSYDALAEKIDGGAPLIATLHDCWENVHVPVDVQNESQYWAAVCEYTRRYKAVRTLIGGSREEV